MLLVLTKVRFHLVGWPDIQWAWTVETMALQELNQELSMWKDYLRTAQRERWKVYNLLCFVDFATPSEARAALETLQDHCCMSTTIKGYACYSEQLSSKLFYLKPHANRLIYFHDFL
uniref:RRM domain-containing protein n=1 Tax=Oryza glumipatula TaxID=40148 RepID=A0A0E0B5K4_9ORYZ